MDAQAAVNIRADSREEKAEEQESSRNSHASVPSVFIEYPLVLGLQRNRANRKERQREREREEERQREGI